MTHKYFLDMSKSERAVWISGYQRFLYMDLPVLRSEKDAGQKFREAFMYGLTLLEAFSYCCPFIQESRKFGNFNARVRVLLKYIERVTSDVERITGEKVDLSDPAMLKPHVGRPTKQEVAARAFAEEKKRSENDLKEPSVFNDSLKDDEDSEPASTTLSGSSSVGSLLHLDQLKWLLPPDLQEKVSSVRELRAKAAENATIAKEMALRGESPSKVEPYAMEAANLTERYELVYQAVDEELARVYVRLREDRSFISEMELRKVIPTELRSVLRPYWDKVADKKTFKEKVIQSILDNDPAQAVLREADEERKKRISLLTRYLERKDKPNTKKRVDTMMQRFEELKSLIGEDAASPFLILVQKAMLDYEEHHKDH